MPLHGTREGQSNRSKRRDGPSHTRFENRDQTVEVLLGPSKFTLQVPRAWSWINLDRPWQYREKGFPRRLTDMKEWINPRQVLFLLIRQARALRTHTIVLNTSTVIPPPWDFAIQIHILHQLSHILYLWMRVAHSKEFKMAVSGSWNGGKKSFRSDQLGRGSPMVKAKRHVG